MILEYISCFLLLASTFLCGCAYLQTDPDYDNFDPETVDRLKFWEAIQETASGEFDDVAQEDFSSEEDGQPLELFDRSIVDYDTRTAPFKATCQVITHHGTFEARGYEFKPKHYVNMTCADTNIKPWSHKGKLPHREYCVNMHHYTDPSEIRKICRTKYISVPVFKRREHTNCWDYTTEKFGVGCNCAIGWTYHG